MRRRPIVATLLGVVGAGLAVLLPAPAAQSEDPVLSEARPLKVVLVGDSFAAGNGARDTDNSTDFYGPEDCLRSSSNWAEKYVDTVQAAFAGHEPDASNKAQNPARWLFEVNEGEPFGLFGDVDAREIYHPNPIGHTEYAQLLAANGTFGAHVTPENGGDIDIAFVLDATGSMAYDIDQMRSYMSTVIDQVEEAGGSARYSLASYRDHPEQSGDPTDYPGRLEQGFTYDGQLVKRAMGDVVASGGGDYPESLYSGVMAALEQQWRPGVKKVVIVLADAPPHEPEPVTGLLVARTSSSRDRHPRGGSLATPGPSTTHWWRRRPARPVSYTPLGPPTTPTCGARARRGPAPAGCSPCV